MRRARRTSSSGMLTAATVVGISVGAGGRSDPSPRRGRVPCSRSRASRNGRARTCWTGRASASASSRASSATRGRQPVARLHQVRPADQAPRSSRSPGPPSAGTTCGSPTRRHRSSRRRRSGRRAASRAPRNSSSPATTASRPPSGTAPTTTSATSRPGPQRNAVTGPRARGGGRAQAGRGRVPSLRRGVGRRTGRRGGGRAAPSARGGRGHPLPFPRPLTVRSLT